MPISKKVRFAYANTYHSAPPTPFLPPGLSHSHSTAPSSGGPITPPNHVLPLPYGVQYTPSYPPPMPVQKTPRYPARVMPHRYLVLDGILWNLLDHPATSIRDRHHLSSRVLAEPASEPALPYIHISSQHLPWSCKVHASNGRYVTVLDVLEALYRAFRINVTQPEFLTLLSDKDRRRATRSYEERYRRQRGGRAYEEEKRGGMKRVDFFMGHTHFGGLSADGHQPQEWHLRVK